MLRNGKKTEENRSAFTVQDEIRRNRRIKRARRIRRTRSRLQKIITTFLCVATGLLFVAAVTIAVTRVQTVRVSGNQRYDTNTLLDAADAVGDILLLLSEDAVYKRVVSVCPYVESVELVKEYPSALEIVVTETEAVYAVRTHGRTMSLDRGLRVMDYTDDTDGLILLELPEIQSALEGSRLAFSEPSSEAFVTEMLANFFSTAAFSLTALDLTDRYMLSGRVGDAVKIVFGDYKNIDVKLKMAEQMLEDAEEAGSAKTLIDVSEPSRASVQYNYTGTFE